MKIISAVFIFLGGMILCQAKMELTDIISTTSGDVQGTVSLTVDGIKYLSFKGIPYGEKPVRFQAPVAKARASHIIQCFKEGANCMQINSSQQIHGSEDCLFLNVYTPLTNLTEKIKDLRAVLVWIHGGAFISGSGDSCKYGPDGLIGHGIVVVTINYRLGALGWLLTDDSRIPGNAGLKDQNLALQWVQNNIQQFGGDPKNVTVAGQSAGSVSVTAQGLSNESKGLFRQMIALSGTVCNTWGFNTRLEAQASAFNLGQLINKKPVLSTDQLVNVLNNASAEELIIGLKNITKTIPVMKCGLDINSPNGTVFLDKCYDKKYKEGNYSVVPTLMGFTKDEALLFTRDIDNIIKEFKSYMSRLGQSDIMVVGFISSYLGRTITSFDQCSIEIFIDIFSQVFFQVGIDLCQRKMCANRNPDVSPIYYYLFDFNAKNYSFHEQFLHITELEGVSHEDELQYIWETCPDILIYPDDPNHPVNVKKRQMTALVANFVKYGNPTPLGDQDPLLNVTWPNSCNKGHHLLIQEKLSVQYKRPIGEIAEALMPFAKLKSYLQSDCLLKL